MYIICSIMQVSEWSKRNFSRRLRRARQNAGLTQGELAERLGTQQSTVSRIEGGQRPRDELLSRVVAFINETQRSSMEIQDDIVSTIAHSNEFRALIARIVAEL